MKYKKLTSAVIFSFVLSHADAQINILRYNDNFAYLKADSSERRWTYKIKYISLWKGANISFGGDLREQMQYYRHRNFGDSQPTRDDTWQLWHRMMGHSNIEIGAKVRVFAQIGSTFRFLNPNPPTPEIDENRLSLHQAFLDYRWNKKLYVRIGRQEIAYGNNRILTFREGPNTRQAFDAASVNYRGKKSKLDVFVLSLVISKPGIFDDSKSGDLISGLYGTETFSAQKFFLDYYFLNYTSSRRKYNYISGKEIRQIYGLRLFSKEPRFNYELEVTYQSGKFNDLLINAFSISGDMRYDLVRKAVTIGFAGNYVSGDRNRNDKELNTYNFLFSKPQYGLTSTIGATNIINVNPYVALNPTKAMHIDAGVYFMYRESTQDGTYSPLGIETRPTPDLLFSSTARQIGTQMSLESTYVINQNISLGIDAGYFLAGKYVKETGKGRDITYLSFKVNVKL